VETHEVKTTHPPGLSGEGRPIRISAREELARFSIEEIQQAWGLACSFDIYECDPGTIRDAEAIRRFVGELCELIEMKRFGECIVVDFGEDERVAGFSMMQLIETSLISAHFANASNTVYLDVFSCKPYDPATVERFATRYFGGSRCITHVNLRR
jgi:S-adenosylmethionine/arginine decarboxylase-like enzyme